MSPNSQPEHSQDLLPAGVAPPERIRGIASREVGGRIVVPGAASQPGERRHIGALALLLLSIPFQELIFPELPLRVPIAYAALVLCIAGAVLRGLPRRTGLELCLAAYVVVIIVSIVQTYLVEGLVPPSFEGYGVRGSRHRGWYLLLNFLALAGMAWVIASYAKTRGQVVRALEWTLAVGAMISLYSIYEVVAKIADLPLIYPSIESPWYRSEAVMVLGDLALPRAYGSFSEPGHFSAYLVGLVIFCALAVSQAGYPQGPRRWLVRLTLISSGIALLLTGSTAGFLALLFVVPLMGSGVLGPISTRAGYVIIVGVLLIVIPLGVLGQELRDGFEFQVMKIQSALGLVENPFIVEQEDSRALGRRLATEKFLEHPILGIGYGNEIFYTRMREIDELLFGSGSLLIQLASETGILGVLAFASIYVRLFILGRRIIRDRLRVDADRAYAMGLALAALGAMLVYGFRGGALSAVLPLYIGLFVAVANLPPAGEGTLVWAANSDGKA